MGDDYNYYYTCWQCSAHVPANLNRNGDFVMRSCSSCFPPEDGTAAGYVDPDDKFVGVPTLTPTHKKHQTPLHKSHFDDEYDDADDVSSFSEGSDNGGDTGWGGGYPGEWGAVVV